MAITRTPIVDDDGSGTTGTVIDNAWKQELYNQIDAATAAAVVIGHGSGIDTNPAASVFSSYVGQVQLATYDTVLLEIELFWTAVVNTQLFFIQSASHTLLQLDTFGNSGGGTLNARVSLRKHPANSQYLFMLAQGGGNAPTQISNYVQIEDWLSPPNGPGWVVAMQHGGIPAGQSLQWKWSVTKHAG
jgi:hypothetical protein